ncbi:hypothetical protein [Undibacterium sp. KW1]|uniref:hypothetical protein n=1 Tax=Undibacterium sp. KW1 TaxID=2058624 RepID=UPI0013895321|nr:hypothetical protein [Undibacterium sp. KW1]
MKNPGAVLTLLFAALASFKFFMAWESVAFNLTLFDSIFTSVMVMAFPQLMWLVVTQFAKSMAQIIIGFIVFFIYAAVYLYCGYIPGIPSIADGEAGIQSGWLFIVEWLCAIFFAVPFVLLRKTAK